MSEYLPTYIIKLGEDVYNCIVERKKNATNGAPCYNVYVTRFTEPFFAGNYTHTKCYKIVSYLTEYQVCEEAIKQFLKL